MTTLLGKDLRLSLDALRPWAIIVGGFTVGVLLFSYLPGGFVPRVLQGMTIGELLSVVGLLVGLSAIGVTAWIATVVVQGDRRRGAHLLAETLPSSGGRIARSKLVAIALGVLAPIVVSVVFQLFGDSLIGPSATGQRAGVFSPIMFCAALAGAAFALFVAPVIRGTFAAVLIALLVGVAACVCGWIGAKLSFWIVAREFLATARESGYGWEIGIMSERASVYAGMAGLAVAIVPSAILGAFSLARMRSRRATTIGVAVVLGCSVIGGIVATAVSVQNDPATDRWDAYWKRRAQQADDAELMSAAQWWIDSRVRQTTTATPYSTVFYFNEAMERISAIPVAALETNQLARAFRAAEDYGTPSKAVESLHLIPMQDPRRLPTVLDCVVRFHGHGRIRDTLWTELFIRNAKMGQPPAVKNWNDLPERRAFHVSIDRASAAELTRLSALEQDDAKRAKMRDAIRLLETSREDN